MPLWESVRTVLARVTARTRNRRRPSPRRPRLRPTVERLEDRTLPSHLIAFESNRDGNPEIYVMNTDGTNQTRLTNNTAQEHQPAWSPDGSKIAFASDRDGNFEIYAMKPDGTSQTRLTNNTAVDFWPTWSPDGSQIAFQSLRDGNNDIYVINADGSGETRLTFDAAPDVAPAWSPDGTSIAFYSHRDGNFEIYVMNADGTDQTRLTNNAVPDANPAWSPDGTQIAFERHEAGSSEVYVMNADGTGQTNLTNHPANDAQPAWSPDGTSIAFRSLRDGNAEIYVMNADGTNQTRLTNNPAADLEPDWRVPAHPLLLAPTDPAAAAVTDVSPILTSQALPPIMAEAIARWQAAGADTAILRQIDVQITDLGGSYLGLASSREVWIDQAAGGYGWFIDPTPGDDGEFTTPGDQGEQGRVDLLSVLAHEFGHVLGLEHSPGEDVMAHALPLGVRRVPGLAHLGEEPANMPALTNDVGAGLALAGPRDGSSLQRALAGGGHGGDDILIAGFTAFDANPTALNALVDEWTSPRDYNTRVANLPGTDTGARATGNYFLKADGPARTVFDDGVQDYLFGEAGQDWFFANVDARVQDTIFGLELGEIVRHRLTHEARV